MTMRERIAAGKLFTDMCEGLPAERDAAKRRMIAFNATGPDDIGKRMALLTEICGRETKAWIEPPFYFCYGTHITLGDGCYINMNCSFVDDGPITVGKQVMFGAAVSIATVGHPLDPELRKKGYMYTAAVAIGDNCWIGSNVTICPGVTIGENAVIGAGSVVTKDIPTNVVAAGNPCRVLHPIDERDRLFYFRDLPIDAADLAEEAALRDGE